MRWRYKKAPAVFTADAKHTSTHRYRSGEPKLNIDSPVIYGVRVETSNPYHLLYIEAVFNWVVPLC